MQNVGGRRDGIRPVEQRPSGELRSSHKPDCRRFVAGNLAILAGSDLGFPDGEVRSEDFGRVGEVVAGLSAISFALASSGFLLNFA